MTINDAVAETLDAIGDDPQYARARALLLDVERLLREGTTSEAAGALEEALSAVDEACPV